MSESHKTVDLYRHPYVQQVRYWLQVKNWNWICLVVGDTGSGKSRASISLADAIDRDWNTLAVRFSKNQILRNPEQFFNNIIEVLREQVEEPTEQGGNMYFNPGTCVVLEEMGSQMSHRDAMKGFNKALSKLFQIFRRTNLAVIGNLPYLKMVDMDVRRLTHTVIKCDRERIDTRNGINYTSIYKIYKDPIEGTPNIGYYRIKRADRKTPQKLTTLPIPNPRDDLISVYEQMDAENKLDIAMKAKQSMAAAQKKEEKMEQKWLEE